nr:MAG TPA: hypothetical protein [Caudoviricetes sp.]
MLIRKLSTTFLLKSKLFFSCLPKRRNYRGYCRKNKNAM